MNSLLLIVAGVVWVSLVIVFVRFAVTLTARRWPRLREEMHYALMLILTASLYVHWAGVGGGREELTVELAGVGFFGALAIAGIRRPLLLAAGWALHPLWDWFLHPMPATSWVPGWFPDVCVGFDLALAVYIGWRACAHAGRSRQKVARATL